MTFTGFNTKFPEYEVITPHSKKSFTVRSLTVQEEEHLKGSFVTPTKIAEHLNMCLFNSLVKKPDGITDLDSFLRNVTIKDRDAILYGLYHITYEEIRNYSVKCTACSKEYQITIKASDTFNYNSYPEDNIIDSRKNVVLPLTKGVTAVIKQPTLLDELTNIKTLSSRPGSTLELITETLIIDKFIQDVENLTQPMVFSDRVDVLDAYLALTARDKRVIYKAYEENYGKYGIELKMKSFCTSCGKEDLFNIDLVENFFRSLYSA